uniref:Dehydrogenase/reductase SDR family member 7B n=1 Tax=Sus scrofa TaxID=9823 RepID=A0A4X1SS72_PIG
MSLHGESCGLRATRAGRRVPGPSASSLTARLCSSRRSLLKARAMDLITSTATLPLLFGCVGVFGLLKLLQWLRTRAYVRDAVVVITGATSGLGRAPTPSWGEVRPGSEVGRACLGRHRPSAPLLSTVEPPDKPSSLCPGGSSLFSCTKRMLTKRGAPAVLDSARRS